jgi:hypothetical protein
MGQYGNQPDFGTRAKEIVPTGSAYDSLEGTDPLKSAALYIGTGGTLVCNVVGGNETPSGTPNTTVFRNIPDGTFFPVIVNNVWINDGTVDVETTCSNIVALY